MFLASVAPSAWLVWAALHGQLSANPLADVTNETGLWTLRFLSLTLCVTPVRRLAGWNDAIRFRRMALLMGRAAPDRLATGPALNRADAQTDLKTEAAMFLLV